VLNEVFQKEPDTRKVEKILPQISEKQQLIEQLTLTHFMDLKYLCDPGQREMLKRLLDDFFLRNQAGSGSGLPETHRPPPPPGGPDIPESDGGPISCRYGN
jgi:hypothetical protein